MRGESLQKFIDARIESIDKLSAPGNVEIYHRGRESYKDLMTAEKERFIRERTLGSLDSLSFAQAVASTWADFDFSHSGGESNRIAADGQRGLQPNW